jgi:hypothetical protein
VLTLDNRTDSAIIKLIDRDRNPVARQLKPDTASLSLLTRARFLPTLARETL